MSKIFRLWGVINRRKSAVREKPKDHLNNNRIGKGTVCWILIILKYLMTKMLFQLFQRLRSNLWNNLERCRNVLQSVLKLHKNDGILKHWQLKSVLDKVKYFTRIQYEISSPAAAQTSRQSQNNSGWNNFDDSSRWTFEKC